MLTVFSALLRNTFSLAVEKQLTFSMAGSQYVVKNIDGLGPIKSDISTIDTPVDPGGTFMSTRTGQRNIVITLGFTPNYQAGTTVSDLRNELYTVFTPGYKIELTFTIVIGGVTKLYYIKGWVESHEPLMFSDDPQVQISIICPSPYFTANESPIVYNLPYGSNTFNFQQPYLLPQSFKLEFDVKSAGNYYSFYLESDSNAGFNVSFPFLVGDKVRIDTNKGSREVVYIRSSATYNIMGYMGGSLVDTRFHPGRNYVRFNEIGATLNAKVTYQPIYPGL